MRSRAVALFAVLFAAPAAAQEGLEPPELSSFVHAEYPREAESLGLEAEVVLRLDVDATGAVTAVEVVEPAGNGFDEAALAACRAFRFDPARRGGAPIASRILYRYRFTLEELVEPAEREPERPQVSELRGWVLDRLGEPIEGAQVMLRVAGAGEVGGRATDDTGAFAFDELPPAQYEVEVAAGGFRVLQTREVLAAGAELRVRYRLREEGARYESVTRSRVAIERDVVRRTLTPDDMRRVPGTSGDALQAVQALPGVARPPFALGLFIVRGSAPDDTLVLLDDHPIPLPYHLGGLATVVTSDLIEKIDLLPGSFSVRHGRISGGVVDVQLRTPRRDRMHGFLDVDLVDAGVLGEVPLGDRGAVAIAARRSYIDAVLPAIFPDDAGLAFTQFPVYWDYQAIADYDISSGTGLRVLASGSDDELALRLDEAAQNDPAIRGSFSTHFAHQQVQARLTSRLAGGAIHRFSPALTWSVTEGDAGPSIHFDFESLLATLRDELDAPIGPHARLRLGVDVQTGAIDTNVRAPQPPDPRETQNPIYGQEVKSYDDERFLTNIGAYAELALEPAAGLSLTAGARFDHLGLIGANVVDPRAGFRWQAHSRLVMKGGLGLYSQPPRGFEVVPGFGNPDLEAERGVHYTIGLEHKLAEPVTLDVQLFGKSLANAAAPSETEGFASTGLGRTVGLETMLVFRPRLPAFGWISYTLSKSERRDAPGEPYRLFEYDQTHILSVVAGTMLPGGFELGCRLRYASGFPETPVAGAVYDADFDVYRPLSAASGSSRIPPFFSLDLRLAKRWRAWGARWTLTLDVQNATVHSNPERRIYAYDYSDSTFATGIPILPSLGLRAEM
ncbi:MAG: TonB-dependent receptor [Deltaproteobacteria bacterium]|nr:TonB-dependent receptor [Deltaproteobacteria bacterium]